MKMQALMTPHNAVNASNNMAMIQYSNATDLRASGEIESKGFRTKPDFRTGMMISSNTLAVIVGKTDGSQRLTMSLPTVAHGATAEGIGRLFGKGTCPGIGSSLIRADACAFGNCLRIILEARLKAAAACSSGLRC